MVATNSSELCFNLIATSIQSRHTLLMRYRARHIAPEADIAPQRAMAPEVDIAP